MASAAIALALSLLALGCGGDDEESDGQAGGDAAARIESFGSEAGGQQAQQAEAALRRYLGARANGEWQKACSHLIGSARDLFGQAAARSGEGGGKRCAAGLASASEGQPPAQRAAFRLAGFDSVRTEGDQAYVVYETADGTRYAVKATREGGRWRFSPLTAQLG